MALCTICSLDPCPHLKLSGGSAGAPLRAAPGAGVKYAPSAKPACPHCDRVHRNIGTDNLPVCAWRTFSKARGSTFLPFDVPNVEEFARWYRAGGWSLPVPRRGKKAAATASAPTAAVPAATVASAEDETTPVVPTVPTFDHLDDDELAAEIVAAEDEATAGSAATLEISDPADEELVAITRGTIFAPAFATKKEDAPVID